MTDRDDPITNAILSDSTYERLRYAEGTVFSIPATRALVVQAGLLAVLALILPLYVVYPDAIAEYLPTLDPFVASPKVLMLGALGWSIEIFAAAMMVALYYYRVRKHPLDDDQARTVFDVQQLAAGLSLVTGGLAIAVTVGLVALGAVGAGAVDAYLSVVAGGDIFAQMDLGFSIGHLAVLSLTSCVGILAIRWVLLRALPEP